jgi:hypothetical protein
MKLFTRNRILGLLSAAMAAFIVSPLAFALTNPPSYPPRTLPLQVIQTFRKTVNFSDANISAGVKFAAIPQGAYITNMRCYVTTAFNAATTNVLTIGTTATGTDILAGGVTANTNCNPAATGNQVLGAAAGVGLGVTGGATATGSTGGFDLFVRYTQTGTAATTGSVTYVIDFVPNNDQ